MTKKQILVGICGAKQAGKDTLGTVIVNCLPNNKRTKTGFMGPPKLAYSQLSGYTMEEIETLKNDPKSNVRHHLQIIADMVKEKNYKNMIDMLQDCINRSEAEIFVITDLRFHFEAGWIKGKGGSIVRIFNTKAEEESDKDPHHSERDYKTIPFDWSVTNNGTLSIFERESKWIAGFIKDRYRL